MIEILQNLLVNVDDWFYSESWDSLFINKRKPHTYRLFKQVGENRVCLHKFETCDESESFLHPHPWPAAFKILSGSYWMNFGFSTNRYSEAKYSERIYLSRGSMYEIKDSHTWHSVTPDKVCHTIMVNGPPFNDLIVHSGVRTTKGKDLEKIPEDEKNYLLREFRTLLRANL